MSNRSLVHHPRGVLWVAVLAAVGLVAAGCGSDSSQSSKSEAATSPTQTTFASTGSGVVAATTTATGAVVSAPETSAVPRTAGGPQTTGGPQATQGPETTAPVDEVGKPTTLAEAGVSANKLLGPIVVPDGATTRGISGKVISIGGVTTVKDSTGVEQFPGVCDGAKARFERANKEGGVNGYTFNVVGCTDDGGNPDATTQDVKDMVETQKVFAIIPFTSSLSTSAKYLNANHVPYFGWGLSHDYCGWNDTQFGFSITSAISCVTALPNEAYFSSTGVATYLAGTKKDPKELKAAFVGSTDDISQIAIRSFKTIATDLGMNVVFAKPSIPGTGSPPLSDYTPVALDIIASGANYVSLPIGPGPIFGLVAALRANGYKGDIQIFFSDSRLAALATQLDGVYASTPNIGTAAYPSDAFKQIRADLDAIGSQAPVDATGTLTSYASADLFLAALAKVQGPLTTEAISKVLNSGFDYPMLGNAVCGSVWPASHAVSANCAALVRFDGASKSIQAISDLTDTNGKSYLLPLGS